MKERGSISGAEVGCQGEIGTACAMAAGAAAYLMGGSLRQIEYASEMGLEHHLGLTCDPVDGLVQIPCIERNAHAATRALSCCHFALLSDGVHKISFPATGYSIAGAAVVRAHLQTPYNRRSPASYNREFLDRYIPNKTFYLSKADRQCLREAGTPIAAPLPAGTYAQRILERLLIDLSWASSRMEGNTYNLLEKAALRFYFLAYFLGNSKNWSSPVFLLI